MCGSLFINFINERINMLNRFFPSILFGAVLMIVCPSEGMASANVFEELLGKPTKKDVFSCPLTIEREKLLELLKAPYKKVPSRTEGGTIPDLVAKPIEIEPGLWAAHKMTDTERLIKLLTADKDEFIYISLEADESRPKGTMGEKYESLIGTYSFRKKDKLEDKEGLRLGGYSLIITIYKEKPKFTE